MSRVQSAGVYVPPSRTAPSAQARVDQAIVRIDALQSDLVALQAAMAIIQDAIRILQSELAALVPPNESDFTKTVHERAGEPPDEHWVTKQVFDSSAYNAALSKYENQVRQLENAIQAKEHELAAKEAELASKEADLADAQQELDDAQRALEQALAHDAEALRAAQDRYREAQERAQRLQQEALRAQAEAQKAQEELQKAQEELARMRAAASELSSAGVEDPEARAAFYETTSDARLAAQVAANTAANHLPRVLDGELLPPITEISARDFIELAPEIASFETGIRAGDSGLLVDAGAMAAGQVTAAALAKMTSIWEAAGFSAAQIQQAQAQLGDPTVDVGEAWTLLTVGYRDSQSLDDAVQFALDEAAGDPEMQAQVIALLQGTNATELSNALFAQFEYSVQDSMIAPPQRPPAPAGITSVPAGPVPGSALEAIAGNVPDNQYPAALCSALDAAALRGLLSPQARDVYDIYLDPARAEEQAAIEQAVSEVHAAEAAYATVLETQSALEEQLAADLATFGPYLTPEQQLAYVQEYRALHAGAYAEIDAAAAALDQAYTANQELVGLALLGPQGSESAGVIFNTMSDLSVSPYAETALTWVASVEDPESAFAPFAAAHDVSEVANQAMAGTVAAYLERNPQATPEEAISYLEDTLVEAYAGWRVSLTGAELKASDLPAALRTGLAGLRALSAGNMSEARTIFQSLPDPDVRWAGGFAALGILLGVLQTADAAGAFGGEPDVLDVLGGGTFTAEQLASGLATFFEATNRSGASALAGRLAGGFNAVGGVIDLVIQGVEIAEGQGNAGTAISISGDLMTIAGGAFMFAGATGIGVPLAAIGPVVLLVGEMVSWGILQREELERRTDLRDEQLQILDAIGVRDLPFAISGPDVVDVAGAFGQLAFYYGTQRDLPSAVTGALQNSDPAVQAQVIALLQATPPGQLNAALYDRWEYGVQDAALPPTQRPPAPEGISEVANVPITDSALRDVAAYVPRDLLLTALTAAVDHGYMTEAEREAYVEFVSP